MKLDTADIQGLIITGYPHLPMSRYFFLNVTDVVCAKQWLAAVAARITSADWKNAAGEIEKPKFATNLAITCEGLTALNLDPATIATFPEEFCSGMGEVNRAGLLGDDGESAPAKWEFGNPGAPPDEHIHILLILETSDAAAMETQSAKCLQEIDAIGGHKVIYVQDGMPLPTKREHFGFMDGVSQPEIEGSPKPGKPSATCLKAGDFILGYENEYALLPPTPTVPAATDPHNCLPPAPSEFGASLKDLGRNGSFMVFRKLEQNVAAFREYTATHGQGNPERLAAQMVGRWQSGTSLVEAPDQDPQLAPPNNDFGYADADPHGLRCPLGAHVRRSNPRDAMSDRDPEQSLIDVRRHRILRRGVPYGPAWEPGTKDNIPRGLLFICINADIKRQFEFIQQTWSNNPKFHGMNNDRDPLIGDNVDPTDKLDELKPRVFTIQKDGVRQRLKLIPRFVTMKGGAYFFVPSIPAIYFLADSTRPGF